jgi:hypothetical protein
MTISWQSKFKRGFAALHPNMKRETENYTAEDWAEVSRIAERTWMRPYGPTIKTVKDAIWLAICALEDIKWEEANPEEAAAIRRGEY